MAVSNEKWYEPKQTLAGSVLAYAFSFRVDATSEVKVRVIDTSGNVTTLTTEFTVTATNNDFTNGGTVTITQAIYDANVGGSIFIWREQAYTQDSKFPDGGDFPESAVEDMGDKIMMRVQQAKGGQDRALVVPEEEIGVDMTLPAAADRAGKTLGFSNDANGTPIAGTVETGSLVSSAMETFVSAADLAAARTELDVYQKADVYQQSQLYTQAEIDALQPIVSFTAGEAITPTDAVGIGIGGKVWKLGWNDDFAKYNNGATGGSYTSTVMRPRVARINSNRVVFLTHNQTSKVTSIHSLLINDVGTCTQEDSYDRSAVGIGAATGGISAIYQDGYFMYWLCESGTCYWRIGQVSTSTGAISWVNAEQSFAVGAILNALGHTMQARTNPNFVVCTSYTGSQAYLFVIKYDGATASSGAAFADTATNSTYPHIDVWDNQIVRIGSRTSPTYAHHVRRFEFNESTLVITAVTADIAGALSAGTIPVAGAIAHLGGEVFIVRADENTSAIDTRVIKIDILTGALQYPHGSEVNQQAESRGSLNQFMMIEKSRYTGIISTANRDQTAHQDQYTLFVMDASEKPVVSYRNAPYGPGTIPLLGGETFHETSPGVWCFPLPDIQVADDQQLLVGHNPVFVGYPTGTYAAGETAQIRVDGVVSGLSGIVPGSSYSWVPDRGAGLKMGSPDTGFPVAQGIASDKLLLTGFKGA